jgi:AbrB family looped-hinge helix DNA binding protein
MISVKISKKFQIVIPRAIREQLRIEPGQRLQVLEKEGCIQLVPEVDIRELRGFLKGMDPSFIREK